MWIFAILIVIQIVSIGLCAVAVKKLYAYINQYKFAESVYTLLFGFIRLRYFVYLYVLMVFALAVLGAVLAISFLNP